MWSENLKLGTSVARCFDMVSHVTRIPIVEFYTMLIEQKRNLTPNNGHPAAPARQSVVGSKNVTIHDNGVCMPTMAMNLRGRNVKQILSISGFL